MRDFAGGFSVADMRRHSMERLQMSLAAAPFHEGCANCATHFPIDLPDEIVEAARRRELVLFAGAGITTERPGLFPETFYEEIEARISETPSGDSFPAVMQTFEDRFWSGRTSSNSH